MKKYSRDKPLKLSCDQTPRNLSDNLGDLALSLLSLALSRLAHFGLVFDEAIPCTMMYKKPSADTGALGFSSDQTSVFLKLSKRPMIWFP